MKNMKLLVKGEAGQTAHFTVCVNFGRIVDITLGTIEANGDVPWNSWISKLLSEASIFVRDDLRELIDWIEWKNKHVELMSVTSTIYLYEE